METEKKAHTIEVNKDFSVPVEQLFKAWTELDQLKEWWHPMGDNLETVKNELKDGGVVEYNFKNKEFNVTGKYNHVEPNKKLVHTWNWEFDDDLKNEDFTLTITFQSKDNGSSIHVLQEGFLMQEAIEPHEEAWKVGLENLKNYVEKSGNLHDELKSDRDMTDRSGGYNESPLQAKVGGG